MELQRINLLFGEQGSDTLVSNKKPQMKKHIDCQQKYENLYHINIVIKDFI